MPIKPELINTAQERLTAEIAKNRKLPDVIKDAWRRALEKAADTLRISETLNFILWDAEKRELLFWSKSNEIYEIGENNCQCPAFAKGWMCYHRSMWMICNHIEEIKKRGEDVPYLANVPEKLPEKLGNCRI